MATAPTIGTFGTEVTLHIRQGATLGPFTVAIRNPDASLVSMVGAVARGSIRRKALDAAVVKTLAIDMTGSASHSFTFGLPAAETATLAAGETVRDADSQYVWDLEWEDALGVVRPVFYGTALVLREVTRG